MTSNLYFSCKSLYLLVLFYLHRMQRIASAQYTCEELFLPNTYLKTPVMSHLISLL